MSLLPCWLKVHGGLLQPCNHLCSCVCGHGVGLGGVWVLCDVCGCDVPWCWGGGHVAMAHVRMTAVPAAPTRACGVGVGTTRKRKKPPMGIEPMTIRLRSECSAN